MITQVIFNIDSQLKAKAMKKAQKEGLPFSAILNFAIKAFVNGQIGIGLVQSFNSMTILDIEKAEKDFSKGKKISPEFSTVAQARKYLDN
jgi:antitoxin component of RelBE/YafQ-DinJ toxin-antitoxin module